MVSKQGHKMPKQEIEELVLHNTRNENDEWVGERFHKGCWIYMQPAAIGPHRVRRRGVLDQHWKGRLLGFKTKKIEGMVAIVQHVYSLSDIHLCSEGERRGFTSNYIFPSTLIEEQPLRSLSGTFLALHATIEKVVLDGRTPSDLAQGRIFFYSHTYIIPTHDGGYGKLESIPSPSLQSSEWPKPDVWSIMALKHKIVSDIHASLKFGKASRSVGLSWCCPIHIFVHLFRTLPFTQAPTMFVCKQVEYEALDFLLGDKWDTVEGMHDGDIYRCNIAHSGISLRYLKLRTTLYIRFHYERWMKKRSKWIPLQVSKEVVEPFDILVTMANGIVETVRASKHWSLANVREHLKIMGAEDVGNCHFKLKRRKIGRRLEATLMVQESWSANDLILSE